MITFLIVELELNGFLLERVPREYFCWEKHLLLAGDTTATRTACGGKG